MTDSTRKIVKIFLASPGDLGDERQVAKDVIDEINSTSADFFGCQVELVGWEDTISIYGRPQEVINRDLRQCEYFVGMMWMKWGTPPDNDGRYTSGFEEEFDIAVTRREESDAPEISLFLKDIDGKLLLNDIDGERLKDLGEQLKKVTAFRDKIKAEKKIIYQSFAEPRDFEKLFRRCVYAYIQRLADREAAIVDASVSENKSLPPTTDTGADESDAQIQGEASALLGEKGAAFLNEFIGKDAAGEDASISAIDIARMRLLACVVGQSGNDSQTIGVHDANELFECRELVDLGRREEVGLVDCGLTHYLGENAPLWYWAAELDYLKRGWLPITSSYGMEGKRIGALKAMRVISEPVVDHELFARDDIVADMLSDSLSNRVKSEALRYLAENGTSDDLETIHKELERDHYETKHAAATAVLRIIARSSIEDALRTLMERQDETVDDELVRELFSDPEQIDAALLKAGAEHRNDKVRLRSVLALRDRAALDTDQAQHLLDDDVAQIRLQAILTMIEAGHEYDDAAARKVLVKPKPMHGGALGMFTFGRAGSDKQGDVALREYREHVMNRASDEELMRQTESGLDLDGQARFVLDERRFAKRGKQLRSDLRDHFSKYFDKTITRIKEKLGSDNESVTRLASPKDSYTADLTRGGMNVLCRSGGKSDLNLVRKLVDVEEIDYSVADVDFLKKHGDWTDVSRLIQMLVRAEKKSTGFMQITDNDVRYRNVADALLKLGTNRPEELLQLDVRNALMVQIVAGMAVSQFKQLRAETIATLLGSSDEKLRRALVLKCGLAFTKAEIKDLLDEYLARAERHYYNVIHWLDFFVSLPQNRSRPAAMALLQAQRQS